MRPHVNWPARGRRAVGLVSRVDLGRSPPPLRVLGQRRGSAQPTATPIRAPAPALSRRCRSGPGLAMQAATISATYSEPTSAGSASSAPLISAAAARLPLGLLLGGLQREQEGVVSHLGLDLGSGSEVVPRRTGTVHALAVGSTRTARLELRTHGVCTCRASPSGAGYPAPLLRLGCTLVCARCASMSTGVLTAHACAAGGAGPDAQRGRSILRRRLWSVGC